MCDEMLQKLLKVLNKIAYSTFTTIPGWLGSPTGCGIETNLSFFLNLPIQFLYLLRKSQFSSQCLRKHSFFLFEKSGNLTCRSEKQYESKSCCFHCCLWQDSHLLLTIFILKLGFLAVYFVDQTSVFIVFRLEITQLVFQRMTQLLKINL